MCRKGGVGLYRDVRLSDIDGAFSEDLFSLERHYIRLLRTS